MFLDTENLNTRKKEDGSLTYNEMVDMFSIVNETYYGKNPILLECENYLKDLKCEIVSGKNPNRSPNKEKFENAISKLFGFENYHLIIIAGSQSLNAFTVPYFYQKNNSYTDDYFKVVKNGNGIRYKDSRGKTLYTYISMYTLRTYDINSIMAILLHEIGHNFFLVKEQIHNVKAKAGVRYILWLLELLKKYNWDKSLFPEVVKSMLDTSTYLKDPQKYMMNIEAKLTTQQMVDKDNKEYRKKTKKSLFNDIKKGFMYTFGVFVGVINTPFNLVKCLFLPFYIGWQRGYYGSTNKQLRKNSAESQSYNAEKFADNFATSYGYGVGIVDTFSKGNYTINSDFYNKIPLYNINLYFDMACFYFGRGYADEHPDDLTRCKFAIEKLKYELSNNPTELNQQQKAEIKADIEKMEKLLNDKKSFQKGIDILFSEYAKEKDTVGSVGVKNSEIFDFDKKDGGIIANQVILEAKNINYQKLIEDDLENYNVFTENASDTITMLFESPELIMNKTFNNFLYQ